MGGGCVLLPAGRRPAADLTAVAGLVRMSTEATMPEGDGRWSSQRPLPHGTLDEPLWIRPDSRTGHSSVEGRPFAASGLSRPGVGWCPESARSRREFAPPRGKVDQSGHIRTQSAPGILGFSRVSEGFKSLLLHHFSSCKQRTFRSFCSSLLTCVRQPSCRHRISSIHVPRSES